MENESASDKIQEAIHKLEQQQEQEEHGLKEQLHDTYESIKPANLMKNTLHDFISAPGVKHDIAAGALSLAAGYAAKRLIVGKGDDTLSMVAGTIVELGVAKVVASQEENIKLLGIAVFRAVRDKIRERRLATDY